MKKLWKNSRNFWILLIFLSTVVLLVWQSEQVRSSVLESVDLFMTNLFPVLFPFFVLTDCAISLKIPILLGELLKPITEKWLHLERPAAFIIVMSILSGFLAGAKYTEDMFQKGYISEETANHLLLFTHYGNPAFVLSFVGIGILNDVRLGIILYLMQLGGSFLLARLTRPKTLPSHHSNHPLESETQNRLGSAISNAFTTLLMMLGSLSLFLIAENIIITMASPSHYGQIGIKMILEVTSGLVSLTYVAIPTELKFLLASICISLGGANIHLQVASYLEKSKLKYKYFLKGRLYGTILQTILVSLLILCSVV